MRGIDSRFRRGLYLMLIALGLLIAVTLQNARESKTDAAHARRIAASTDAKNGQLLVQVSELLSQQRILLTRLNDQARTDSRRNAAAAQERTALLARIARLEAFILQLLSESSDHRVADAARRARARQSPSPTPSPSRSPSPAPSGSPRPTPSPTPTCLLEVGQFCVCDKSSRPRCA